ncbi:conserved hypothetical protein [Bradyrhizobium sp. ORS 375]|nr:conserved hypothetical protein [Bradyrhizobium sp. ORS 375]
MAMDPALLSKELDALTRELSRLLGDGAGHQPASNGSSAAAAIDALSAGLSKTDVQIERLIRDRPVTATLAAFACGMVLGLVLRRS